LKRSAGRSKVASHKLNAGCHWLWVNIARVTADFAITRILASLAFQHRMKNISNPDKIRAAKLLQL
jgi:hypothetical protein